MQLQRNNEGNLLVSITDLSRKNEKSYFVCDEDSIKSLIRLNL